MWIFISGGCKNGKSTHAQRIAKGQCPQGKPLYYLATMTPKDEEDRERIHRHRQERAGWGFETVEVSGSLRGALEAGLDPAGSALLDSVTALLSEAMFLPDGSVDREAHLRLESELLELLAACPNLVLVSDGIYSDPGPYGALTEAFRQRLAWLDRVLARTCDVVLEAAYGSLIPWKGSWREAGGDGRVEGVLDGPGDVFHIPRAQA